MELKEWYRKKSLELLSDKLDPHLHYFHNLKPKLLEANINLSLREYVCIAALTVILVFLIETPLLAFVFGFISPFTTTVALLLSLTISMAITISLAFFFYIYPSMRASSRAEKIEQSLPFATTYLATIAGSGLPAADIFKVMAEFEEYDAIKGETKKITGNVELFGMNVIESLAKTAKETPSEKFKKLLWGLVSSIRSGVDLQEFLHERSRELMREYERELEEYSDSLGTFLQMYLTLIIVGSIFAIIVTSIMSSFGIGGDMGGMIVMLHFSIVFIFLPVITTGFIWLLKTTYPGE